MAKYLIEVPHEGGEAACLQAIQILLSTGSHYLTNADWGCKAGVHKAWAMVEVEKEEEARAILPPAYRSQARIVKLNKFSREEVEELIRHHKP
ncbi:MAG TPA: hypothetical protein VLB09_06225 [Nitrospiria bacterium]|nr:hypothetical protein [Nitrospiria bacterium]